MTKLDFKNKSDEELLVLIQKDQLEAYEIFFDRHKMAVYRYAFKKGLTPPLAEEALQIIFEKIFEKRGLYLSHYKAAQWLYIIAKSEIKDLRNREKTQDLRKNDLLKSQTEGSTPFKEQVPPTEEQDFWSLTDELWKDLSEEDRRLLKMRFVEDLSFEEISRQLKLSNETLRKRLSRLFQKVKKGDLP